MRAPKVSKKPPVSAYPEGIAHLPILFQHKRFDFE
eukprot:COSAG01_NODE_55107_length_327_cov_0.912281_1_plen_34_part_01